MANHAPPLPACIDQSACRWHHTVLVLGKLRGGSRRCRTRHRECCLGVVRSAVFCCSCRACIAGWASVVPWFPPVPNRPVHRLPLPSRTRHGTWRSRRHNSCRVSQHSKASLNYRKRSSRRRLCLSSWLTSLIRNWIPWLSEISRWLPAMPLMRRICSSPLSTSWVLPCSV